MVSMVVTSSGNSSSFTVPKSSYQFGFIGALHDGMGTASVYLFIATIDESLITAEDRFKMKFASKSCMSILYVSDVLTKDSVYTITVDSGEIMLTGIITGEKPDLDDDDQDSDSKSGSGGKTGAIVGGVIGVVIVVIIAVIAFFTI